LPFRDEEETVQFIMEVYHGFKQTRVDANIWEAFQTLVFEVNTGNEPEKLLFNEEKLRLGTSFRGLRLNNFALDQLSTQRHAERFE
jgi:hypothetical protein